MLSNSVNTELDNFTRSALTLGEMLRNSYSAQIAATSSLIYLNLRIKVITEMMESLAKICGLGENIDVYT